MNRTALSQLEQQAPGLRRPALELSNIDCSNTHKNTLQVLQRTALGPAPPKVDPADEEGPAPPKAGPADEDSKMHYF
jgi:hypothetical protein